MMSIGNLVLPETSAMISLLSAVEIVASITTLTVAITMRWRMRIIRVAVIITVLAGVSYPAYEYASGAPSLSSVLHFLLAILPAAVALGGLVAIVVGLLHWKMWVVYAGGITIVVTMVVFGVTTTGMMGVSG
ncbi:MAG: hypothetical protein OXK17_08395 [Thaumarchaeota archaeon]|nr:hypothetical protein [Nitrososphaerota archaeon]